MPLFDTIKSALGLGDSAGADQGGEAADSREARTDAGAPGTSPGPTEHGDRTVEPDAATERAVKTEQNDGRAAADASKAGPAKSPAEEAAVDTTAIKGIGSAYAERLAAAGVETVPDLAGADAEALAAETDLSAARIEGWIEQAEARTP